MTMTAERLKRLYDAHRLDAAAIARAVTLGLITQAEADGITWAAG